jgi:hypothetical protein
MTIILEKILILKCFMASDSEEICFLSTIIRYTEALQTEYMYLNVR